METLAYSGTLTVVTCWCGMSHAVPTELRDFQLRQFHDGRKVQDIYCPLGHTHVPAGETKAAQLEWQLEQARRSRDATRDLLEHEQRSHSATRGHLTRAKKRAVAGVCPHPDCHRHFQNLERHIAAKHPELLAEAEALGG